MSDDIKRLEELLKAAEQLVELEDHDGLWDCNCNSSHRPSCPFFEFSTALSRLKKGPFQNIKKLELPLGMARSQSYGADDIHAKLKRELDEAVDCVQSQASVIGQRDAELAALRAEVDRADEREQEAAAEINTLHAKVADLERERDRLRDACRELTACARGDFDCLVCGRPCYESDQTPAGYLCSRCCPHPAEVERDEALAALACLRDAAVHRWTNARGHGCMRGAQGGAIELASGRWHLHSLSNKPDPNPARGSEEEAVRWCVGVDLADLPTAAAEYVQRVKREAFDEGANAVDSKGCLPGIDPNPYATAPATEGGNDG